MCTYRSTDVAWVLLTQRTMPRTYLYTHSRVLVFNYNNTNIYMSMLQIRLELIRDFSHKILSLECLPIPPLELLRKEWCGWKPNKPTTPMPKTKPKTNKEILLV